MYSYNILQWLLFFYIYCIAGWCFESTYVSLKEHHPVNRGFMHGPVVPIYGTGAIVILFACLPFQAIPAAVYVTGLLAATLLEYVVGVSMEAIFKVRYWDYSNQKFNYQGHICLSSSIAWGFLSLIMVYGIHKPIERAILGLPNTLMVSTVTVITVIFASDFTTSLRTALDIRDLIIQAEKMRTDIERIRRRIEIIDAFARADLEERGDRLLEHLEEAMESRLGVEIHLREQLHDSLKDLSAHIKRIRTQASANRELLRETTQHLREEFSASHRPKHPHIPEITEQELSYSTLPENYQADTAMQNITSYHEKLNAYMTELDEYHTNVAVWRDRLTRQFSIDKQKMLRRNPSAICRTRPELLQELREHVLKDETHSKN